MSDAGLIGRHGEIAAIEAALDTDGGGPAALLLLGEAGIGKSSLVRAAVAASTGRALRTLIARPGEMESRSAFAVLTDLLRDLDEALKKLPDPQRRALRVATLRESPTGWEVDPHVVAVAFRNLLLELGSEGRLAIVIDDAHWIDEPSRLVLDHVAARLDNSPVRWIVAARPEGEERLRLRDAVGPDRLVIRTVGPLSAAALLIIIRERLGETLPRHLLVRIADASRGNPFFALELARAVIAHGDLQPGRPLPVSAGPGELVLGRVRALEHPTRQALLLLAAMDKPSLETLRQTAGDTSVVALDPAETAGMVIRVAGAIRFDHPLTAAAAYDAADSAERRAAHRHLAANTSDPEVRARHLARAATEPDESIAAQLEAAAEVADARGARSSAVELQEGACRLTPPSDAQLLAARRLQLAERLEALGEGSRAAAEANVVIATAAPGPLRARARLVLGRFRRWSEGWQAAQEEATAAQQEPGLDLSVMAQIDDFLGEIAPTEIESLEHSDRAIARLREANEPAPLAEILVARLESAAWLGQGLDEESLAEAIALESTWPPRQVSLSGRKLQALSLLASDDVSGSRAALRALVREAEERGEEASLLSLHQHTMRVELAAGRWLEAESLALAFLELADAAQNRGYLVIGMLRLGAIDAMLGRETRARERLTHAGHAARALNFDFGFALASAYLGLLELSLSDFRAAVEKLRTAQDKSDGRGVVDPAVFPFTGDLIEALVEVGALEEASQRLDDLRRRAHRLSRIRALGTAARASALLQAANGDIERGIEDAEDAMRIHAAIEAPFEHARSVLVAGRVHRRARHKSRAHALLGEAAGAFEASGTAFWARQARAELGRVGLRPSAPATLTDTEQQVAELAARGMTNRQVADAAFITQRSVEGVLRRVYGKLGISSRAELGAAMNSRDNGSRDR